MIKRYLLLVVFFKVNFFVFAQDISYAKGVITTLCSPEMNGRGYVERGDRAAAEFIAGEFQKSGLKKYSKTYFQNYTTPVNSFPGKLSLALNGKELVAGKDYLIEPGSPGISGSFNTVELTANDLLDETSWTDKVKSSSNKFIVVSAYDKKKFDPTQQKKIGEVINFFKYSKDHPAKGTIILTIDKLTWSGSTELLGKPSFTVVTSSVTSSVSKIDVDVENKFFKNYETQNVVGYIEGKNTDSLLVLTAHYDHLGKMGKDALFPGANDNASGIALLLSIVRHFAVNKPEYTIVFIAFSGEEIGLIGSQYFTDHPLFALNKIKFLINFDLAGTGDEGIQIVNGKMYQAKFDLITSINKNLNLLPQIKIRGEACNSDHCMFHMKGVPCFYIYTLGGIQAYHDINDKAETLPLTEFQDYFRLMIEFINRL
jgi:aminopeptidase YwaD